jgi:hypothetical protein
MQQGSPSTKPKTVIFSTLLCLLCLTACNPPGASKFLSAFDPEKTLSEIGNSTHISYSNESSSISTSTGTFSNTQTSKDWAFNFQGSSTELSNQLNRFRTEIENQLSANDCTISGRGNWSGDFSGFDFEYRSGGMKGVIRVSGVSLESGKQAIEIFVYEY